MATFIELLKISVLTLFQQLYFLRLNTGFFSTTLVFMNNLADDQPTNDHLFDSSFMRPLGMCYLSFEILVSSLVVRMPYKIHLIDYLIDLR